MKLCPESLTDLAQALRSAAQKQRAGRYRVHRGPVDWAAWPFEIWPLGWTIEFADVELLQDFGNDVQLSMEIVARARRGAEIELDDGLLQDFRTDALVVLSTVEQAVNESGDSIVLGSRFLNVRAAELFDPSASVQGIIVSCDCKI